MQFKSILTIKIAMNGDVEIPASDLKKHHIIKIDGSWCSIMDVKNDKLGSARRVRVAAEFCIRNYMLHLITICYT
jgi:hypothetical protein